MLEVITAIALLCQVSGSYPDTVFKQQLKCQKDYLICINKDKRTVSLSDKLERCIMIKEEKEGRK